jgi:Ran GTPase-activating protein (RanGAP) involved in mRNA processing and transport
MQRDIKKFKVLADDKIENQFKPHLEALHLSDNAIGRKLNEKFVEAVAEMKQSKNTK